MNKRKIVLLATALCMIAILAIGGTLAYFTDTETVQNVFTVGGVDITLDEPSWNEDATHTLMPGTVFAKDPTITVAADSQDAWVFLEMDLNKYVSLVNLMGVDAYKNVDSLKGQTYPGFMAFVAKLIDDNALRAEVLGRWFGDIDHSKWTVMNLDELEAWVKGAGDQTNPTVLKIILGHKEIMSAKESVTFMTSFGMPATVTASMLDGEDAYYIDGVSKSNFNTDKSNFKMTFTAYAIQAAELDTLDAAYAALFN